MFRRFISTALISFFFYIGLAFNSSVALAVAGADFKSVYLDGYQSEIDPAIFTEDELCRQFFIEHNFNGSILFYDIDEKRLFGYNLEHALTPFTPSSTFKFVSSLIALDSKTINDVDEICYRYNGEDVPFSRWMRNMSLRTAFSLSNTNVFKLLAARIGVEKYNLAMQKVGFINFSVNKSHLTNFWLDDSFQYSSLTDIDVLYKLYKKSLPFSAKHQQDVLDISVIAIFDEEGNIKRASNAENNDISSMDKYYVLHGKSNSLELIHANGVFRYAGLVTNHTGDAQVFSFVCDKPQSLPLNDVMRAINKLFADLGILPMPQEAYQALEDKHQYHKKFFGNASMVATEKVRFTPKRELGQSDDFYQDPLLD